MRGLEEIKGLLQTWPEGFRERFQRKLTNKELVDYLSNLKRQREIESIQNQFETFHPHEIDTLLKCLSENRFENLEYDESQAPAPVDIPETPKKKKKGK